MIDAHYVRYFKSIQIYLDFCYTEIFSIFSNQSISDEVDNLQNVQFSHLGQNAYTITFTRKDNTLDTKNDVVLTDVKEVFVLTQHQQSYNQQNVLNSALCSRNFQNVKLRLDFVEMIISIWFTK